MNGIGEKYTYWERTPALFLFSNTSVILSGGANGHDSIDKHLQSMDAQGKLTKTEGERDIVNTHTTTTHTHLTPQNSGTWCFWSPEMCKVRSCLVAPLLARNALIPLPRYHRYEIKTSLTYQSYSCFSLFHSPSLSQATPPTSGPPVSASTSS